MKKTLLFAVLTLVLGACSTRGNRFKMEGRLLNLNQGEFRVYSTDGLIGKVDTIRVEGGRFNYEIPCNESGTLMIVFPNYSQQPVFAELGKKVNVKGDASHLKEMTIEGTDDNELMTAFRLQTANDSPPDVKKRAEQFIADNPLSPVSVYLLERYFVLIPDADYDKAAQLAATLMKNQPKNGRLIRLANRLKVYQKTRPFQRMVVFEASDINGRSVGSSSLRDKIGVVCVWSTWDYESQDALRRLKAVKSDVGDRLAVVGINIDASKRECRDYLRRDSLPWPTICDEQVFNSPLLEKLGMQNIPDNIVVDKEGKIVARGLSPDKLREKLEEILK